MVRPATAPTVRFARRLALTALALTGALALLVLAGARLPGPVVPIASARAWRWAGPAAPPDLVVGVVHAATVTVTAYLLVSALLELACAAMPLRPSCVRADIHLPIGGALVARLAATGLALSVTVAPAAAAGPAPVLMHVIAGPRTTPPVLHRLGPGTRTVRARPPEAPPPAPSTSEVWVIRPGDNLWQVARSTLVAHGRRRVSDAEVAEYLDRLVARNAAVLVVRGHPELVYPGQRFVLP